MSRLASKVVIYLDGKPLVVPRNVDCHWAARGALGLLRGVAVAREEEPSTRLEFTMGHEFTEGDRYVSVDASSLVEDGSEEREPWQVDPEAWKASR